MRRAAVAGRRKRQLARIGFAVGDHLRHRFHRWPALIVMISGRSARKMIEVKSLQRVVRRVGVDQRADAVGGDRIHQQRVAVGRRLRDIVGRDGAAGAAAGC